MFEAPKPMNESRHHNTYQPLLFAPAKLLSHGLRDAHHYPRVGERKAGGGVRSWQTSPSKAWAYPLIEWPRTATSYCALVLDCDSIESQELALDVIEVGSLDLPRPQRRCAAVCFGPSSTRVESANTCPPRGVGASPATCGLQTYQGVLHGHAPLGPRLCGLPVL